MLIGVFVSSLSQILLKKAAMQQYDNSLKFYLNPKVIFAYFLFFGCTLLSVYALKVVPLSMSPILESVGYIFVAILSYIFFKERLNKKQILGMGLIILGIVVFTL